MLNYSELALTLKPGVEQVATASNTGKFDRQVAAQRKKNLFCNIGYRGRSVRELVIHSIS